MNRRQWLIGAALAAAGLAGASQTDIARDSARELRAFYYHSTHQSTPEDFEHFVNLIADYIRAQKGHFSQPSTVSRQEFAEKEMQLRQWERARIPDVNLNSSKFSAKGFENHNYIYAKEGRNINLGRIVDFEYRNRKTPGIIPAVYTDYGSNGQYRIVLFKYIVEPLNLNPNRVMFFPEGTGLNRVYVNVDALMNEANNLWEGSCKIGGSSDRRCADVYNAAKSNPLFAKNPKEAFKQEFARAIIETIGKHHEPAHLFLGYNETGADLATLENMPKDCIVGNYLIGNMFAVDPKLANLFRKNGISLNEFERLSLDDISKKAGYVHSKTKQEELK